MKAKIIATGELIDVVYYGDEFAQILPEGDYKVYTKQELELIDEPNWQQVRIQAAVNITCQSSEHWLGAGYSEQQIARQAISLADALAAELQKKGGEQ